jgi:hypothetical protein
MGDDQLRMRAVVEDGFTAPLSDLRKQLRVIGSNSTASAVQKDWKGVGKSVTGVANSLRLGVAGGLRAVGLGSLAAGVGVTNLAAGLAAVAVGVRKFGNSVNDMRRFSDQVGMTVNQVNQLKNLGDRFGISWEATQGSLKAFSDNLRQMRNHWGAAYNELRGMNLSNLAENVAKAPDMKSAVDRALEGIKKVQDPVLRRKVAEILLGSDQWAVVAAETTAKIRAQMDAAIPPITNKTAESAKKLTDDLWSLNSAMKNLKSKSLGPLLRFYGVARIGGGVTIKEREIGAKIARDEKALESVKGLIDDARKRGDSVVPELQRKRDELIKQIEQLRKTIEKTNQQGALLQNQSFNGTAIGGGRVIPASLGVIPRGFGLQRPLLRFGSSAYPLLDLNGGIGGARSSGGQRSAGRVAHRDGEVPAGSGPRAGGLGGSKRDVARIVADEWRRAGMSDKGIAGLMANIAEESSFNPRLRHADQPRWSGEAHYAHGLYQEGGAEWNRYAAWLAKNHPSADWRDPRLQSRFAAENLKMNYPGVWRKMRDAEDRVTAGAAYAAGYLKPKAEYLRSRIAKFGRRGIPALEHYTGPMGGSQTPNMAAPGNTIDLLAAAQRAEAARMVHEVHGKAALEINLNGLPAAAKVRSSFDGMFREVKLIRSRPIQSAYGEGP